MRNFYSKLVFTLLLSLFASLGWGQVNIINTETMYNGSGGASGNTIAVHESNNRFENDALTMSGTGDMRTTNVSSGYTTASGASASGTWNVLLNANTETFIISGINTTAYSSISLSFGIKKSTNAENGSSLAIDVSTNGTTWTALTMPSLPTGSGTGTPWNYRTCSGTIPATSNLRIRFTSSYGTNSFNIDDVELRGSLACVSPDTSASSINIASITSSGATVSWTNGNGDNRLVFVKQTSSGSPVPVDSTTFTASATFGSGTQIGTTGWYCVYKGTGSSVAVTGLTGSTAYRVMIVEYNCAAGQEEYLVTSNTGNTANFTTTSSGTPSLSLTPMGAFGSNCIGGTYGPQSFNITGSSLTSADIIVSPLVGFQYSTTSGGTYTDSLVLTQSGGAYFQTIYVRFVPTIVLNYSGTVNVNGGGTITSGVATSASGINATSTLASPTSSAITANSATLGGNITSLGCSNAAVRGVEWSTTNGFANGTGTQVSSSGSFGTGAFTESVGSLPGGTVIYFKAFATNSGGTAYTAQASFTTLRAEPSNFPTSFACGTTTEANIPLSWTAATGTVTPDGYLVKWSSTSYAAISDPADGIAESNGATTQNVVGTSYTVTGLSASTTFYFKIWSYTNSGSNINYKLVSEPQTTCATIAGPCFSMNGPSFPTTTGFTTGGDTDSGGSPTSTIRLASGSSGGSISTTATGVTAGNVTLTFRAKGWSVSETSVTVNLDGNIQNVTTLPTSFGEVTLYFTSISANPTLTFSTVTNKRVHIGNVKLYCTPACTPPTTQAASLTSNTITATSMNVAFTRGNGTGGVLVVARAGSAVNADPSNGSTYTANSTFGTSGTEIGTGNYVVYNGTANGVSTASGNIPVSGLNAGTTYHYAVYEYNTTDNCYNLTALTGNFTTSPPNVVLSSANPAVAVGNITQGTTNNVIYSFALTPSLGNVSLTGVTITTSGTYAASNITNFKCWYSADATFGGDVIKSTKTATLGSGTHVFPSFSAQTINSGSTGYIFVTADLPCSATDGNTIAVSAITTTDLTFASANKSGTAFAGGTKTIVSATPNNVTGLATGNCENGGVNLSWTAPVGCSDNVFVFASTTPITGTPTGTGASYTANTTYGTGTNHANLGYCVFKGTGTSVAVTGLTNGTTYYYKVFTRNDNSWTSGVEVSCTPTLSYCTPSTTLACDEYISSVIFNTINNNSGAAGTCGTSGYSNYTAQSTTLTQGEDYTISISIGELTTPDLYFGYADNDLGVWIDWNQDGDFVDAGEEVVADMNNGGSGGFVISVPMSATVGTTRMRVRVFYDDVDFGPCGVADYGEAEDYTIVIEEPCTPNASITSFAPISGPEGTEVTINGSGFTGATNVSFNGVSATIFTVVSATKIIAELPATSTGEISILDNAGCAATSSTEFTYIDLTGTCAGSVSDLIISEVQDPSSGNDHYVEIYNGTGASINMNASGTDYSIRVVNNNGANTYYSTYDITGAILDGQAYVIAAGNASASLSDEGGPSGFNDGSDRIELYKNGTLLDVFTGPSSASYNYRRNSSVTSPNNTYNASEWTSSGGPTNANIGSHTGPTSTAIITGNPIDVNDCSATFSVTATGSPSFQWYYNENDGSSTTWTSLSNGTFLGATVSGATTNSLSITGATSLLDKYQFYCNVTVGSCTEFSNAVQFNPNFKNYYRTKQSGNWANVANWEVATSTGGPWTAACSVPNNLNSDYVSIENGFSIEIFEGTGTPDLRVDQLIIQDGATLILGVDAELEIENGAAGSDFQIEGTFIDASSSGAGNGTNFNTGATWSIIADATIIKTNTSSGTSYRDNFETGIANIPATANWIQRYDGTGSVTIANSASGAPMYYPNLSFESTSGNHDFDVLTEVFTGRHERVTIKGDLTIGGNGNTVKVINNNFNSLPILIQGDLYIAASCELSNEPYSTPNGNYDVQWREGSGFELKGDALIEGIFDVSHFAPSTASSTDRIAPGNEGVIFSGSALQDIIGDAAESFITNDATINNANNIALTDIDLEINDELKFTTGKILTDVSTSDLVWVKNTATSAITGGNTSGTSNYIEGKLQWTTDGASAYTFPIGHATQNAQGFTITPTGTSGSEILGFLEPYSFAPLQVRAYCDVETSTAAGQQVGQGTAGTDGILDQITFNINSPLQWDITNPGGGVSSYDVTVLANGSQDINPITSAGGTPIRYLMKNGEPGNPSVSTSTGAPAFNSTGFLACPNQYSLMGLTSFSKFTLDGATQAATALPVELIYFDAKKKDEQSVFCSWSTASEVNNDYFTLERSADGENFYELTQVQGAGNSSSKMDYEFLDKEPLSGVSYYRLKQTDFDGAFTYSHIEVVNFKVASAQITVYPNPVKDVLVLESTTEESVSYVMTDLNGKIVFKNDFTFIHQIDMKNFSSGVYFIKVVSGQNAEAIKIIKD